MACALPGLATLARPGAKPWECCGHAAALASRGAGARENARLHSEAKAQAWLAHSQGSLRSQGLARSLGSAVALLQPRLPAERGPVTSWDSILKPRRKHGLRTPRARYARKAWREALGVLRPCRSPRFPRSGGPGERGTPFCSQGASMACALPGLATLARPGAKPWECCGHAAALASRGAGARENARLHSEAKAQAWLAHSQGSLRSQGLARSLGSAAAMPQPWLPAERGPVTSRDSIL